MGPILVSSLNRTAEILPVLETLSGTNTQSSSALVQRIGSTI